MQNGQKGDLLSRDVIFFLAETENVLICHVNAWLGLNLELYFYTKILLTSACSGMGFYS